LNIVRNAAQALRERIAQGDAKIELRTRIARKVTIAKRLYRLALDLHVIDNGPGIPEEIRDRIFYPLVSGREDGSGLGLTLAQVASVLDGDARGLDAALAAHEAALDHGIHDFVSKLDRVRAMRAGLARGRMPADGELT
ncbi:ATP-binding protein, partial [Bacillus subtilis]|nr:ATP-binding protein [Bacillus subtilis]